MQQALEEMIDELVNGKESNWKEDVRRSRFEHSQRHVSGLGRNLMARQQCILVQQIPVGYDASYNPMQPILQNASAVHGNLTNQT